jgi:hypothetical protein
VKLTIHLHLLLRLRMVELYFHFSIHPLDTVLNYLNPRDIFTYFCHIKPLDNSYSNLLGALPELRCKLTWFPDPARSLCGSRKLKSQRIKVVRVCEVSFYYAKTFLVYSLKFYELCSSECCGVRTQQYHVDPMRRRDWVATPCSSETSRRFG